MRLLCLARRHAVVLAAASVVLYISACGESEEPVVDDASLLPVDAGTGSECASGGCGGAGGSAAGASAGGASAGPRAPATPAGPLPDLALDAAYLLDTTEEDEVTITDACLVQQGCAGGLGERRVVRFGSRTGNVGDAPFDLGTREEDNPLWTVDACQGDLDLVGFGRYELLEAATGSVVSTSVKNAFCVADAEAWDTEDASGCDQTFDCNTQGISPGCADNYGSALECQWVDITEVEPGAYVMRVTINAGAQVAEADYTNNVVEVELQITEDEVLVTR